MAKVLPPGTYQDLVATEPLVLQKGAYVFVNLRMKVPGAGVGLDGRKATSLSLLGCRFEGGGMRGTGVLAAKDLTIRGCHFSGLENGVKIGSPKTKASRAIVNQLTITANSFTNNLTGVYLDNGLHNLELRCNVFSQTTPIPSGQTHIGLLIGQGVSLAGNKIGGNGTAAVPGFPNSNYFPRIGSGLNAGPLDGYVSIKNESVNPINYWAYGNELVRNVVPDISSGLLNYITLNTLPGLTYTVNNQNIVDWCSTHFNNSACGYGSSIDCEADLLNNSSCTGGVTWVKPCTGGPTDQVVWPVARAAVSPGVAPVTPTLPYSGSKVSSLGQSIPNPGKDWISIPYYLAENSGHASLQILEMATGKVLLTFTNLNSGEGQLQVDVSKLLPGVYGYRLLTEKGAMPKALNFVVIH